MSQVHLGTSGRKQPLGSIGVMARSVDAALKAGAHGFAEELVDRIYNLADSYDAALINTGAFSWKGSTSSSELYDQGIIGQTGSLFERFYEGPNASTCNDRFTNWQTLHDPWAGDHQRAAQVASASESSSSPDAMTTSPKPLRLPKFDHETRTLLKMRLAVSRPMR